MSIDQELPVLEVPLDEIGATEQANIGDLEWPSHPEAQIRVTANIVRLKDELELQPNGSTASEVNSASLIVLGELSKKHRLDTMVEFFTLVASSYGMNRLIESRQEDLSENEMVKLTTFMDFCLDVNTRVLDVLGYTKKKKIVYGALHTFREKPVVYHLESSNDEE